MRKAEVDFWDGKLAYRELERARLQQWIRLKNQDAGRPHSNVRDWRQAEAIREIMTAVARYKRFSGKIVQSNAEFRKAEKFVDKTLNRFRRYAARASEGEFKRFLSESAKRLLRDFFELQRQREEQWSKKYGFWGRELLDHGYKRVPVSERDVDTLLQISLAKILRVFLRKEHRISLETIARLIVLVYMSAGLVEIKPDCLLIKTTGKELKVEDVRQRLHRAQVR